MQKAPQVLSYGNDLNGPLNAIHIQSTENINDATATVFFACKCKANNKRINAINTTNFMAPLFNRPGATLTWIVTNLYHLVNFFLGLSPKYIDPFGMGIYIIY